MKILVINGPNLNFLGIREKGIYGTMTYEDLVKLLEEKGKEIAERIYERHTVITSMLEHIGVDKETAAADACKIEHDISDTTFECLKKYFEKHNG